MPNYYKHADYIEFTRRMYTAVNYLHISFDTHVFFSLRSSSKIKKKCVRLFSCHGYFTFWNDALCGRDGH